MSSFLPRASLLIHDLDGLLALHAAALNAGFEPVVVCVDPCEEEPSPPAFSRMSAAHRELPPRAVLVAPTRSASLGNVLRGFDVDVLVVHRWSEPLPKDVVAIPPLGVLRAHESLPRWRGPHPVERAILAGDATFSVSVHRIDGVGVGTGPVLARRELPLPDDTDRTLVDRLLLDAVEDAVREALDRVAVGETGVPQNETRATNAAPLEGDAFETADPTASRKALHDLVRCHRYMDLAGPTATIDGADFRLSETSLNPVHGRRFDCADGALWVTRAVSEALPVEFLPATPRCLGEILDVDTAAPPRTWTTHGAPDLANAIIDAVHKIVTAEAARLGLVEHPKQWWAIAALVAEQTVRRQGLDTPVLAPAGTRGLASFESGGGELTAAEVRALIAVARGIPDHTAAETLGVSIERYAEDLRSARTRLNAPTPGAAVALAHALGLLSEADHAAPVPQASHTRWTTNPPATPTPRHDMPAGTDRPESEGTPEAVMPRATAPATET